MIQMKNVGKMYVTGSVEFEALKGINLHIREREFC
ncbi:MAG: ABC transporter ATP-binding protein, partial [candidate division Zixibacteria bacterium]|nr:ABC transporter ATP-binding protein [candidate division Zixibacteria bacterium]